ncbi:MAG: two-component system, OmpR family, sensor histidine kinase PrrB [Solirubrobacteraceae bacterium]|nr:two-component system, OmpR family, sensor histidine kinase PrrB [Solirubrobacteraceae bacterium]
MKSLRGRLTLGVVLVLAAVLAVAGVLVSRYVDSSERAALDDRLERTAQLSEATALDAVQDGLPENDRRLDAALEATVTSLRLLVGPTVLLDTGAPPPKRPRLRLGLQTFASDGQRYRAYATTLRDPDLEGIARLEVVTGLRSLERRQSELDRRLLGLGALTLLVAAAGTWLAAELVLRPVRRLRRVAAGVAGDEDLGRRVPEDDGPGELRSLAASFNAMLERLGRSTADRERALHATQRFAADAGHELRTPLTSVQASLDALRRHPGLPEDRRAAMLQDAATEQRRLVDLLDGLQALARGDAPEAEHATVDLAELVDAAVVAAAARHPDADVSAGLPDAPVAVRGWEPGLRLLVDNLVENAAVHGRRGGRVLVTLEAAGPVLHVDDDGAGVPPAERERIFEPFARVDGTGRPGSGLGLALVSQQARHHGATVTVGDAPLGGARFTLRFGGPG